MKTHDSDMVNVIFLKRHGLWAYLEDDIAPMPRETALKLQEGDEPYVKIISDEEVNRITEERSRIPEVIIPEYVKVLFLKPHPEYSYKEGNVGIVTVDRAPVLLEDGYIKLVTDQEIEELQRKRKKEPSKEEPTIRVKWLKPHFRYAYNENDICLLFPDQAKVLIEEGYVTLFQEGAGQGINLLQKFLNKHFK